jgi:hypothetical protein
MIAVLQDMVEKYPERGFRKLFKLIRRRGLAWNPKRVWRGYPQQLRLDNGPEFVSAAIAD